MKKLMILIGLMLVSSTWAMAQNANPVQPPEGMSEIAAWSVFYENYKNGDYQSALQYGRWIYKDMPKTIKGYSKFSLPDNMSRLIACYDSLASKNDDPSIKSAYVDTASQLYDKVFKNFSKNDIDYFQWYIDRGRFYQNHSDAFENSKQKAAQEYEKAFDMNAEKLTKLGKGYYVQFIVSNMISNQQKQKALATIQKAEPNASDQLKKYFDHVRGSLFSSPKQEMQYLQQKITADPKDTADMVKLRGIYEQQGMNDKAQQINKKLYNLNPNFTNTQKLADAALQNANYDEAIKYLKEAKNKTQNKDKLKNVYLNLSNVYLNKNDLQEARHYAREAEHEDPSWGKPYIQIASIYANAVSNCSGNSKLSIKDKAVYWLVLDYLDKAKRVDPSVASQANQQIKAYKPVAPTTEDVFFKNWKAGQKIKIDSSLKKCYGWINETTTVRKK